MAVESEVPNWIWIAISGIAACLGVIMFKLRNNTAPPSSSGVQGKLVVRNAAGNEVHPSSQALSTRQDTAASTGYETHNFPDGGSYVGYLRNGKFDGPGTYTYPDGGTYIGEFEDGKFHGQGVYNFPDGSSYVGDFWDNNFHGQGSFFSFTGELTKNGVWRNSEFVRPNNLPTAAISAEALAITTENRNQSAVINKQSPWK